MTVPAVLAPLQFEPAQAADFEALVELRILAMRESLERIGRFDAARARERFRLTFVAECTRHICVHGEKVGFVVLKHEAEALLLDHLYVHPMHQGRGIGGAVLARVFEEADVVGRLIRVGALSASASNRFYLRHGFVKESEGPWDTYYIRPSRSHSALGSPHTANKIG